MQGGCATLGLPLVTTEEVVTQSFPTGGPASVVVETFDGPVTVDAGAGDRVDAEVRKRGSGRDAGAAQVDLTNIDVAMTREGDAIRVIVSRKEGSRPTGNSSAAVRLVVPAGSTASLRTSNGTIASDGLGGPVTARTTNGDINVRGARGRLEFDTTNGGLDVEAADAVVTASTTNGRIHFRGSLAEGRNSFRTTNGAIELTLPRDAKFVLDAGTTNGVIENEFATTGSGGPDRNHLVGRVGDDPDVAIGLLTTNGGIAIRQGR